MIRVKLHQFWVRRGWNYAYEARIWSSKFAVLPDRRHLSTAEPKQIRTTALQRAANSNLIILPLCGNRPTNHTFLEHCALCPSHSVIISLQSLNSKYIPVSTKIISIKYFKCISQLSNDRKQSKHFFKWYVIIDYLLRTKYICT